MILFGRRIAASTSRQCGFRSLNTNGYNVLNHRQQPATQFLRHAGFVVGGSAITFLSLSAWSTHRQLDRFQESVFSSRGLRIILPSWDDLKQRWSGSSDRLSPQHRYRQCQRLVNEYCSALPDIAKDFMVMICTKWRELSPNETLIWSMICLNSLIFVSWQFAPRTLMTRIFTDRTFTRQSYPMLTAMWSHAEPFHLLANMYALHSFGPALMQDMSMTNDDGWAQFLAFYLSAGMVSSIFSRYCRQFAAISSSIGGNVSARGSLGASGALFGVLGVYAMQNSDSRLQLIFLPGITFSARDGLMGMMVIDLLCILTRRTMFDHFAHLGGALFGVAYHYYSTLKPSGECEWIIWSEFQRFTYAFWKAYYQWTSK